MHIYVEILYFLSLCYIYICYKPTGQWCNSCQSCLLCHLYYKIIKKKAKKIFFVFIQLFTDWCFSLLRICSSIPFPFSSKKHTVVPFFFIMHILPQIFLFENILILLAFWKNIFTWHKLVGWQIFFFYNSNMIISFSSSFWCQVRTEVDSNAFPCM